MEFIPADQILKFNPTTLEDIRKCWNLENGRLEESVTILEEWVSKQNHFVNKEFKRDYLEKTLVVCKGSVEKSKTLIDKLCTLKTLLPHFFIDGDLRRNLEEVVDIVYVTPMPKLTKENYRTVIVKINSKSFTSAHYMKFYQLVLVYCEYLKCHDYCNGFIIIKDLRDVNLVELLSKINFVEFQQFMTTLIDGFGARIKGIHFLTPSKVIEMFIKTIKPFLSAKLVDRILVHRDLEELQIMVEKETLPMEYGGPERSIEKLKNEWLDVLCSEENEKYLAVMKASCTDESLRTADKFNEQIMGLPGSFRTLHVD